MSDQNADGVSQGFGPGDAGGGLDGDNSKVGMDVFSGHNFEYVVPNGGGGPPAPPPQQQQQQFAQFYQRMQQAMMNPQFAANYLEMNMGAASVGGGSMAGTPKGSVNGSNGDGRIPAAHPQYFQRMPMSQDTNGPVGNKAGVVDLNGSMNNAGGAGNANNRNFIPGSGMGAFYTLQQNAQVSNMANAANGAINSQIANNVGNANQQNFAGNSGTFLQLRSSAPTVNGNFVPMNQIPMPNSAKASSGSSKSGGKNRSRSGASLKKNQQSQKVPISGANVGGQKIPLMPSNYPADSSVSSVGNLTYNIRKYLSDMALLKVHDLVNAINTSTGHVDLWSFWKKNADELFTQTGSIRYSRKSESELSHYKLSASLIPIFFVVLSRLGVVRIELVTSQVRAQVLSNGYVYFNCPRVTFTCHYIDGSYVTHFSQMKGLFNPHLKVDWVDICIHSFVPGIEWNSLEKLIGNPVISSEIAEKLQESKHEHKDLNDFKNSARNSVPVNINALKQLRSYFNVFNSISKTGIPEELLRSIQVGDVMTSMKDILVYRKLNQINSPQKAMKQYVQNNLKDKQTVSISATTSKSPADERVLPSDPDPSKNKFDNMLSQNKAYANFVKKRNKAAESSAGKKKPEELNLAVKSETSIADQMYLHDQNSISSQHDKISPKTTRDTETGSPHKRRNSSVTPDSITDTDNYIGLMKSISNDDISNKNKKQKK